MKLVNHPKKQLKKQWIEIIRAEAVAAENAGRLTTRQLALFYDEQWFKALVPKIYGGLQWPLTKIVRFEEAIGWADGSAGWVFTLCSGAGWFGGFMEPVFATKIFAKKKACMAGSGAVGGRTSLLSNGQLEINGFWKYATGAPHGTVFTANCYKGKTEAIKAYCLLPGEVKIHPTWDAFGLVASASESFSVSGVTISPVRGFDIDPGKPVVEDPVYKFPFLALAEATIAANLSGMALHFLEEAALLWKEKGYLKIKKAGAALPDQTGGKYDEFYSRQLANWQKASQRLHQAVDALEKLLTRTKNEKITETVAYHKKAAAVSHSAQALASSCRELVSEVYRHCGLSSTKKSGALSRVWRDFQTGSQHSLFEPVL